MSGAPNPPAARARRADARRNHERVLAAASELFAVQGTAMTTSDVAARAGVGKATLYRSYPTKNDLLAAVVAHEVEALRELAAAVGESTDPAAALHEYVRATLARPAIRRIAAEFPALRRVPGFDAAAAIAVAVATGDAALDAARGTGRVRDDITGEELRVLIGGTAQQLVQDDVTDPATWNRYADLIIAALRP